MKTLTNLDLVFDDNWSVYESYLADYCPQNVQPFPSGGGGAGVDGKYGETSNLYAVHANDVLLLFTLHVHARNVSAHELFIRSDIFRSLSFSREDRIYNVILCSNRKGTRRCLD